MIHMKFEMVTKGISTFGSQQQNIINFDDKNDPKQNFPG